MAPKIDQNRFPANPCAPLISQVNIWITKNNIGKIFI